MTTKDITPTLENTVTGFALATQVNRVLAAAGLDEIRPQMVYSYMSPKQGLIPTVEVATEAGTKRRVLITDAQAWIDKYVGRKAARAAEASQPQAAESTPASA